MRYAKRHRIRILVYMTIIALSLSASFAVFLVVIRPVFLKRVEYFAHKSATEAINSSIEEVFSKSSFDELVLLEKNSDGTVSALKSNTVEMNKLRASVSKSLEENLSEFDSGYISIPVGSLVGNELLSGVGPDIKIKIKPLGKLYIDFYDNFESCGINQSRHTVYLKASMDISIITTQVKSTGSVSAKIPVSETVIVGNVPTVLGNGYKTLLDD